MSPVMQNKESFTYSWHGRADDGQAESIRRSLLLSMRGGFFIVQGEGARGQKEGLQGTQPSAFDYIYCILFVIYPVISLVAFMPYPAVGAKIVDIRGGGGGFPRHNFDIFG